MKSWIAAACLCLAALHLHAQKPLGIQLGYLGETITHPGAIAGIEYDKPLSERFSLPLAANVGFYHHKRNHTATFAVASAGLRLHFCKRLFLTGQVGVGPMLSWNNSDLGVFSVDESGNISQESNLAGLDLLVSATPEIGFKTSKDPAKQDHIWIRSRAFWQFHVNNRPMLHANLEIGYTYHFNR